MSTQRFYLALSVLGAVFSAAPGCATKKYVAASVTPVNQRVDKVEARDKEQDGQLETLETDLSRTRESVGDLKTNLNGLDSQLKTTSETAKGAASAAQQAQQQATDARSYAGTRSDALEKTIDGLDKYKLSRSLNVLFDSGKSELNKDGRASLDEVAKEVSGMRRYAVEVQGYTDSTGPASLNYELSQRRAQAVVRYLTVEHKIPLRNIHLIGAGSATPVADNHTRDGRKQNRRVEIRLFTAEAAGNTATAAQLR